MSDETKIELRENGPLVVKAPPRLTGPDGAEVETGAVAALCRCGASKNKPFCDGSHNAVGFDSGRDAGKLRTSAIAYSGVVEGQEVTISYTPVLCSHAAECSRRAGNVFNPKQKPWIQPEAGKLAEIFEVMAACPSGALRVSLGGGEPQHLTTGDASISIEKNGPYHVKNVPVPADAAAEGASRTKYVLCRCGLSKNKPYCDGSHYDAGWSDGG